jgi:hypothetical protein
MDTITTYIKLSLLLRKWVQDILEHEYQPLITGKINSQYGIST